MPAAPQVHRVPAWAVWVGFVALCNATGIVSSLIAGDPGLYREIAKPAWAPPPSVFGPVWTALYTLMGAATAMVWHSKDRAPALTIFAIQLVTNFLWTPVFFGLQRFDLAVIVIGMNWTALVAMTIAYARRRRIAGWLVVPTLAWVTFATALNVALWWLNR
jgi:tryptophan-rich sensory protein